MFATAVMPGESNVPEAIPCFVGMKVREWTFPAIRKGARITVVGIKAIVNVPIESTRSTKPGSRTNKYTSNEPVWSVVPVGGAAVRGIVKVAIGTVGGKFDTS
jgi:hypothetical protein